MTRARALVCSRGRRNPLTRAAHHALVITRDSASLDDAMPGRRRCVVVADATSARILLAQIHHGLAMELIEHSELENLAHRMQLDSRFAAAVAHHVRTIVKDWPSGSVVIAAAPATLANLREVLQSALPKGVKLRALAKDYISLSAPELAQRLNF